MSDNALLLVATGLLAAIFLSWNREWTIFSLIDRLASNRPKEDEPDHADQLLKMNDALRRKNKEHRFFDCDR